MKRKSVLAIVAHGDDLEFMAGGTIARMADQGHDTFQVIATNNERGSLDREWRQDLLADARREEARRGAGVLGVKEVEFLGYEDGRLSEVPLNEIRERCMRAIRRLKADVVFTWDPFAPYENHQDHRQIALAAMEAATFAHFPLYHPEHADEGLEPHYVGEQYYFAKSPRDANKVVDIGPYLGRKIDALCEHVSQMELTVAGLMADLRASGLDIPELRGLDPKSYRPAIERQITSWARSVGRRNGYEYGEEFRRVRFGALERIAREFNVELEDDL